MQHQLPGIIHLTGQTGDGDNEQWPSAAFIASQGIRLLPSSKHKRPRWAADPQPPGSPLATGHRQMLGHNGTQNPRPPQVSLTPTISSIRHLTWPVVPNSTHYGYWLTCLLVVTIVKHIPPWQPPPCQPHGSQGPEDLTKESQFSSTAPCLIFHPKPIPTCRPHPIYRPPCTSTWPAELGWMHNAHHQNRQLPAV